MEKFSEKLVSAIVEPKVLAGALVGVGLTLTGPLISGRDDELESASTDATVNFMHVSGFQVPSVPQGAVSRDPCPPKDDGMVIQVSKIGEIFGMGDIDREGAIYKLMEIAKEIESPLYTFMRLERIVYQHEGSIHLSSIMRYPNSIDTFKTIQEALKYIGRYEYGVDGDPVRTMLAVERYHNELNGRLEEGKKIKDVGKFFGRTSLFWIRKDYMEVKKRASSVM